MREIRTSGLMSGVGKRDGGLRQHPRPASTLPCEPGFGPAVPRGSAERSPKGLPHWWRATRWPYKVLNPVNTKSIPVLEHPAAAEPPRTVVLPAPPAAISGPAVNPWIIALTVLATFMEVLDTSVANLSLPHIAGNLSASLDESTWVLTSQLVSNAIVLPVAGWFSSLFGRKRFYMFCVATFTVASCLCGFAPCTFRHRCRQTPQRSRRRPNRSMWTIMYRSPSSTFVTLCAFNPNCFLRNVSTSTSIPFLRWLLIPSPQKIRCIGDSGRPLPWQPTASKTLHLQLHFWGKSRKFSRKIKFVCNEVR